MSCKQNGPSKSPCNSHLQAAAVKYPRNRVREAERAEAVPAAANEGAASVEAHSGFFDVQIVDEPASACSRQKIK